MHCFVDRLVEDHPQFIDVDALEQALDHAKEVLPSLDVTHMMQYNPSTIYQFQRGTRLIPYDEPQSAD